MEFIDLKTQQELIKSTLDQKIRAVISHGKYIMGPEVKELEDKLSDYVGAEYAIGCASGTDALLIALMALNVGPGCAVFTTPFTFIATAEVISLLGATPVFVDIDSKTFNINVNHLEKAIEAVIKNDYNMHPLPAICKKKPIKAKGIIAVDLFGLPADYKTLSKIGKKNDLFIIEDAAQSFGAEIAGMKACSFGDVACTSFFPAKPLGCYGDGGMCFTSNREVAEILKSLRVHGAGSHKYDNVRIGVNARLDTIQAAIVLAKFTIFKEEVEHRQKIAERYRKLFKINNGCVKIPEVPEGYKSVWAQYSILAKDTNERSSLMKKLESINTPTAVYYPRPLHLQSAFSYLGYREGAFPISEDCARRIFSLPMHPYLKEEEQEAISKCINNA